MMLNTIVSDLKIMEGVDEIIMDFKQVSKSKKCHYLAYFT